jgi:hypothetical protein
MKIKKMKVEKFDLILSDDGYWEYNRVGLVKKGKKVYVCDVDDDGENGINNMYYVIGVSSKSIEDVCELGVFCKVFSKINDEYCCREDYSDEDEKKFFELIK